jgi:hypothetical protein
MVRPAALQALVILAAFPSSSLAAPGATAALPPVVAPPTGDEASPDGAGAAPTPTPVPAPTPSPRPASPEPDAGSPKWHEAEYPAAAAAWECAKRGAPNCGRFTQASAAEPPSPSRHRHDGFFLRASLGLGVLHPSVGPPSGASKSEDARPTVEIFLGGTPAPGLVIGAGYFVIDSNSVDQALFGLSGLVQYYPNPTQGLHFQAIAGFSVLSRAGQDANGTYSEPGANVAAGLGYDFWIGGQTSMGIFARAGYARITGATSVDVGFGGVLGTFTWH